MEWIGGSVFRSKQLQIHKDNMIHELMRRPIWPRLFLCKSPKNIVLRELETHGFLFQVVTHLTILLKKVMKLTLRLWKRISQRQHTHGIVVKPFKVIHYNDLCDSDIKNLDGTPVNL